MGRLRLWWHRNVVGGLHDHEEGDEHVVCSGCRYEREVLWPPETLRLRTPTAGPG